MARPEVLRRAWSSAATPFGVPQGVPPSGPVFFLDNHSVEQTLQFLPQPVEDAGLGDVNGALADAQLGGHLGGGAAADDVFPAGTPGGRLEFRLHQRQRTAEQMPAVIAFPERIGRVRRDPQRSQPQPEQGRFVQSVQSVLPLQGPGRKPAAADGIASKTSAHATQRQ